MQRDKVTLNTNERVTLQLKYGTGKMMADRGFGPSVMYTTSDDRVLFVDLETSQRISGLALEPGESMVICKQQRAGESKRVNVWLSPATERMRAVKAGELPVSQNCDANDPLVGQLAGSLANVSEGKHPATPRPMPAAVARQAQRVSHSPQLGTGTHGPAPLPRQAVTPIKATYGAAMQEFLIMAGRATRQAETTLGAEGGSVRFDSRDVAALATTMLIQAAKEGWITWRPGECL